MDILEVLTQHLCLSISRGTKSNDLVLILVWLLLNYVILELSIPYCCSRWRRDLECKADGLAIL